MGLSKVKVFNLRDPKTLLSILLQLSILLLSVAYPLMYPKQASAAVTEGFVRFDRLTTGTTPITGSACLKSTVGGQTKVEIVFPTDWTISGTAANWTVNNTNLPYDPTAPTIQATYWPSIATATSVIGNNTVIFPGAALTPGTFYCFNFSGASSTVGPAGPSKLGELKTEGGSPYVDDVVWATQVVTSNAELITVSASVSATMTFSLDGNAIALGTLSTGAVSQGAPTVTESVSTNARNGWTTWVKSANAGLNSAGGGTIASPGSYGTTPQDLAAQAGYVVAVAAGTGSPTVYGNWLDGAVNTKGGHVDTVFDQVATKTTPGSGDTVVYTARAKAAATTKPAGDYADTLTITAAGSF
jgi:hypothetical protein